MQTLLTPEDPSRRSAQEGSAPARAPAWAGWPALAAVVALALGVRVALLSSLHHSLYGDFLLWDEQTYQAWSEALLQHAPFRVYDQSSLPAHVMALVYRLSGLDPLHVRVVNLAFGVGTCALVYLIGRELRGPLAGLLAGAAVAIYRPFAFYSVTLLKESLGLLLFAALLLAFLVGLRAELRRRALVLAAFGALAALTANLRQNAIAIYPVLVVPLLWTAWRARPRLRSLLGAGAAMTLGFAALLAPFLADTYRQTGQLSPTPVGGFNLYLGNYLPSGVPFYRPVPFASSNPQEHAIHFTIEASRRVGRPLTGGEASSYWTRQVLAEAAAQPAAFARRLGQKALAVVSRWEEHDNHDTEFLAAYVPALRLPMLTYGLVLPLGLAGLCVLARRDRRWAALLAASTVYALTLVAVWPNARYRTPLALVLVPAAAAAVVTVLAERLRRRTLLPLAAIAAVAAAVEWVPIPGAGDRTAALNAHAINLMQHGRPEEAAAFWRRSAEADGAYSAFAWAGLAQAAVQRGDGAAARALLAHVPDSSFAVALRDDLVGDSWMASGDPARAAESYERALWVNSASRWGYVKLIQALGAFAPERVAEVEARRARVDAFYEVR